MPDLGNSRRPERPTEIFGVYNLLTEKTLAIPQYQRPYKWTEKQINQLFSAISIHHGESAYRLGTVVLHKEGDGEGSKKILSTVITAPSAYLWLSARSFSVKKR